MIIIFIPALTGGIFVTNLILSVLLIYWMFARGIIYLRCKKVTLIIGLSATLILMYNLAIFELDPVRIAQYGIAFAGVWLGLNLKHVERVKIFLVIFSLMHVTFCLITTKPLFAGNLNTEMLYLTLICVILGSSERNQVDGKFLFGLLYMSYVLLAMVMLKCWIISLVVFILLLIVFFGAVVSVLLGIVIFVTLIVYLDDSVVMNLAMNSFFAGYENDPIADGFRGSILVRFYGLGYFFSNIPEALILPNPLQGSGTAIASIVDPMNVNVGSFHTPLLTVWMETGILGIGCFMYIWYRRRDVLDMRLLFVILLGSFAMSDAYLSAISYWMILGLYVRYKTIHRLFKSSQPQ